MKAGSASHLSSHLINVCCGQGCHPTRLQIWPTPSLTPSRSSVLQAALYLTSASYKPSFGIVIGIIWSAAEHCQAQAKHAIPWTLPNWWAVPRCRRQSKSGLSLSCSSCWALQRMNLELVCGHVHVEAFSVVWFWPSGQCSAWATVFPRPCACSPQTLKSARSVLKLAPRPFASTSSTAFTCSCIKTKPIWQLLVSYSHLRALLDAGRQGQAPCNCC